MKIWIIVLIMLLSGQTAAEVIYKSKDKHGNVSYSSIPPSNGRVVKKILPPPKPSNQEVQRAKRRYKELEIRVANQAREQELSAKEYELLKKEKAELQWRQKVVQGLRRRPTVLLFTGNYGYVSPRRFY